MKLNAVIVYQIYTKTLTKIGERSFFELKLHIIKRYLKIPICTICFLKFEFDFGKNGVKM